MKRLSLYILSSLLLITAGCKEDYNQLATGYGDLGITLSIDTTITNIALAQPIKIDAPDINSISISAKGENGNLREWKNIEEFEQTHKMIPVDNYTFQASSGQTDAEGYVTPVFAAECKAYVNDNSLTEISLDCKVASTIITSTKRINNQIIKDLSIRVKSDNGKYVALSRNDMAAMINPGKIRGEVTITDNSGREVTIQPIEIENAESAEHYEIYATTPDDGSNTICFVYDGHTMNSPMTVEINDALFSTAPPIFKTQGLQENNILEISENETIETPVICELTIPGGLQHLYLSVHSSISSNGFNINETDIANGISDTLSGLIIAEGNTEGSEFVTIDFTELASCLPASNGESTAYDITLQAKDKQGRVSGTPCTITIVINPVNIRIMPPEEIPLEADKAIFNVVYNGDDFNDIQLQYETSGDIWNTLKTVSVSNNDDGTYSVTTIIPEELHMLKVRAEYKNGLRYSEPVILRRQIPEFGVICERDNIWTSKADIIITGDYAEKIIKYISVYIKEKGGDLHPAVIERVPEEHRITISTLMPSTGYSIVVSTSANDEKHIDFTTEDAVELSNGDFEDNIKETINIPLINCGGKYSNLNSWMPTYNTSSIKVSEAEGWASVNAKTCSEHARTSNTWFKVPTTEIIRNSYEGQYAVKLTNAAWDINGIEPPRDTRTDDGYFSRNAPHIANRSVGKIFLGTYTFAADGSEKYEEGISFTSRPTAITGYYYYRQDVNDTEETGLVTIRLINETDGNATVIGEGRGELHASTSFTRFSVPVTYTIRNMQATKLQVMVSSSCYASYDQSEETRKIKTTDHLEKGVSTGAELVIDDLQLLYE